MESEDDIFLVVGCWVRVLGICVLDRGFLFVLVLFFLFRFNKVFRWFLKFWFELLNWLELLL